MQVTRSLCALPCPSLLWPHTPHQVQDGFIFCGLRVSMLMLDVFKLQSPTHTIAPTLGYTLSYFQLQCESLFLQSFRQPIVIRKRAWANCKHAKCYVLTLCWIILPRTQRGLESNNYFFFNESIFSQLNISSSMKKSFPKCLFLLQRKPSISQLIISSQKHLYSNEVVYNACPSTLLSCQRT